MGCAGEGVCLCHGSSPGRKCGPCDNVCVQLLGQGQNEGYREE